MASRSGLGRTRRVDVRQLLIQKLVRDNTAVLEKIFRVNDLR